MSTYQFLPGRRSRISQRVNPGFPDDRLVGSPSPWTTVLCTRVTTGSGQVSSYSLQTDGSISLLNGAASNTSALSRPIDMALSRDGINLYVHQAGTKAIAVFEINPDGSLNKRNRTLGLPIGAQGLAAH